ncbi:MAG: DNA polymerase [Tannerellaceae bacterium]
MSVLSIDIETYSPVNLPDTGVYPYCEHLGFEILLFAYAFDDEPTQVVDLASGEKLPERVREALINPSVTKRAFNASFERNCLSAELLCGSDPAQWECTMIKAATIGLPLNLAGVGTVLKLKDQKMDEGKALINYFSKPCKPTARNGGRTRNLPRHDPEKWELFKSYCIRDVDVERSIAKKLARFETTEAERKLYILDQLINDRGVELDMELVHNAIKMDAEYKERLADEANTLTGLDNPNSVSQLKAWIEETTGEKIEKLNKESLKELLTTVGDKEVLRMLKIRQEMAKTSCTKYNKMAEAVCSDGRVKGLLQFYGANRTGRWAGRLVQVQNLPQNHLDDLDEARNLVKDGDMEEMEMFYDNIPDTLSQLIRTAFVAKKGHTFFVADFSAIEARVIAWLAGEQWRLDVFATHGKIYEASAAQMFHVPIESIKKGSPLRQKGKVAELALGYQGGPGALTAMGALKMGIPEDELQVIVDAWRKASPAIVQLWYDIQDAVMKVIKKGEPVIIRQGGLRFEIIKDILFITLPSGRKLAYMCPRIGTNRFGGSSITYWGMDQTTKQWKQLETYGGKLTENIIQAIARDCLAVSMLRLEEAGYRIVMHVHDEVILEMPVDGKYSLEEACEIMGQPIEWAKGLPLRADGYVTPYYKKD